MSLVTSPFCSDQEDEAIQALWDAINIKAAEEGVSPRTFACTALTKLPLRVVVANDLSRKWDRWTLTLSTNHFEGHPDDLVYVLSSDFFRNDKLVFSDAELLVEKVFDEDSKVKAHVAVLVHLLVKKAVWYDWDQSRARGHPP